MGPTKASDLVVLVDLCLAAEEFFTMLFLNYHLRKKIVMWIMKHFSCRNWWGVCGLSSDRSGSLCDIITS